MIGNHDDDRVFECAGIFKLIVDSTENLVQLGDAGVITGDRFFPLPIRYVVKHLLDTSVQIRAIRVIITQIPRQLDGVDIVVREGFMAGQQSFVRFGETDDTTPGLRFRQTSGEKLLCLFKGDSRVAFLDGRLGRGVMQDGVVALGPAYMARQAFVDFRQGTFVTLAHVADKLVGLESIGLPAEIFQLVRPLDMPFAEITGAIAGRHQLRSPMRLVGSEHALVVIAAMFHFQHAVVMRQKSSHQAGPGR